MREPGRIGRSRGNIGRCAAAAAGVWLASSLFAGTAIVRAQAVTAAAWAEFLRADTEARATVPAFVALERRVRALADWEPATTLDEVAHRFSELGHLNGDIARIESVWPEAPTESLRVQVEQGARLVASSTLAIVQAEHGARSAELEAALRAAGGCERERRAYDQCRPGVEACLRSVADHEARCRAGCVGSNAPACEADCRSDERTRCDALDDACLPAGEAYSECQSQTCTMATAAVGRCEAESGTSPARSAEHRAEVCARARSVEGACSAEQEAASRVFAARESEQRAQELWRRAHAHEFARDRTRDGLALVPDDAALATVRDTVAASVRACGPIGGQPTTGVRVTFLATGGLTQAQVRPADGVDPRDAAARECIGRALASARIAPFRADSFSAVIEFAATAQAAAP